MGFCAHEWRHKHNRHHTSPNMETLDGNVSQLPLFGPTHPKIPPNFRQAFAADF
eukprot:COSAG04_NODE_500_length_13366_cov_33.972488_12_plen_54_part_00